MGYFTRGRSMKRRKQEWMNEAKPEITAAVGRLLAALTQAKRGTFWNWHDFGVLAGMTRDHPSFPRVFSKTRRMLLKQNGVLLLAIPTEGAQLATHEQQLARPTLRLLKASRQTRYGVRETAAIPDSELTVGQRNMKYAAIQRLKHARSAANSQRCRYAALLKTKGE